MPQEDKIKREIDRIGLMLAKLLNNLLDKGPGHKDAIDSVQRQFKDELGIDLAHFLSMNMGDDVLWLVDGHGFTIAHLRNFGNLLYELARDVNDGDYRKQLLRKTLTVYEYIDEHSGSTMYLDVAYRIRELK